MSELMTKHNGLEWKNNSKERLKICPLSALNALWRPTWSQDCSPLCSTTRKAAHDCQKGACRLPSRWPKEAEAPRSWRVDQVSRIQLRCCKSKTAWLKMGEAILHGASFGSEIDLKPEDGPDEQCAPAVHHRQSLASSTSIKLRRRFKPKRHEIVEEGPTQCGQ